MDSTSSSSTSAVYQVFPNEKQSFFLLVIIRHEINFLCEYIEYWVEYGLQRGGGLLLNDDN